jgi:acyl carrier protein
MHYHNLINREEVRLKVCELIKALLEEPISSNEIDVSLSLIINESSKAIEFVAILEDEFNIEFEDDEIDMTFFTNFEILVDRIMNHTSSPQRKTVLPIKGEGNVKTLHQN